MSDRFLEKKTITFFLITLLAVICGYLFIFRSETIRYWFNSVYVKPQYYLSYSSQKISALKDEYSDYISAVKKLRAYKTENERITQKLNEQSFIENQNKELKKMLKFADKLPNIVLTTRIISSSIDNFIGRIILPVGENDGIKIGMGIVNNLGVIGRVVDVGRDFSDVLLITDPNSRIVGFNPTTQDKMIIAGLGDQKLRANFVEATNKMKVGEIVYTTGEGAYFPEGLPIGKISKLEEETVILKPLFDIQKTHYVQIISNQRSRHG